jgi:endonuclease III-like uncharacterized protein
VEKGSATMRTIQVEKSFERFDVQVGDETIQCVIDCTDTKVNQMAANAIKAKDKALALDALKTKTTELKKLEEMSRKMAEILKPIIVGGIGNESYDAILTACGDGVTLKPEQCNLVMVQVFATVVQAYVERLTTVKQSKAAHYLQDVVKDAQKPDAEQ